MSWPDALVAVVGIVGFTTILVACRVTSIQYTPPPRARDDARHGYFWESYCIPAAPKPAAPDTREKDAARPRPAQTAAADQPHAQPADDAQRHAD